MKMLAGIMKEERRGNLESYIAYHLSSHPSVVDECHLVRSSRWSVVFPKHSSWFPLAEVAEFPTRS